MSQKDPESATPKPGESITLDSLQHDILIPQIQAFLDATNEPEAREVYLALKTAIDTLEVPANLQARLGGSSKSH